MARTMYQRARDFENAVRRDMESRGYVAVRSAGSRTPADVYCFDLVSKVFIQCKTNGRMDPDEWNEFYALCKSVGAYPIMACRGKGNRGIEYWLLSGTKKPHERQPMARWIPTKGARHEIQTIEGR